MKKNIIIYIIAVILAFVLGYVFAGGSGGWYRHPFNRGFGMMQGAGPGGPGMRGFGPGPGFGRGNLYNYDRMKEDLGLSDKQLKQLFDLGTQYREKFFENRNNSEKIEELSTEHKKAVESIFTKDQLEKFKNSGKWPRGIMGGCPFWR